jgi:transposase
VRTFKVSRTSVHHWVKAYRAQGQRALKAKKRGRPRRSRLAGHQAATAVKLITDRCPDQLKMPFVLWTRQAVCHLLADRFDIHISVWTAGRYLKHWNLTPQKPLRRAYEQNPKEVKRWLNEAYPAIRRRAKREKAEIHWGDEMGVRSDHQVGRSYGKRGQTPVIPGTGKRFGCNMISTVTNRGTLRFMVFKQRFTQGVMMMFLGRLLRSTQRKVFLIVDGHPTHRGKRLKQWLLDRADRIELFFLPGYSPQLNPDELLNQDVKSHIGRRRAKDQTELMNDMRSRLRSTQRQPAKVKRYFHEQHVAYAAQ